MSHPLPSRAARPGASALAALLLLAAAPGARAQVEEPDLRARKLDRDVVIDIVPGALLPVPLEWNLYRGDLADVSLPLQIGDPDGRCAVPGVDADIVLSGELDIPGDFYYVLSAVPGPGDETALGFHSDGTERVNANPCPPTGPPCGTEIAPTASITGTEGLAIAPDGTIYYSRSGAVGRRRPGLAPENAWVVLPGATTVWGMALRADGMLFVGSPAGTGNVYRIDTTLGSPFGMVLYANAGRANGVTIGPDQAIYYSDFGGNRVYRVDDFGTRTEVTASQIAQANGLLFDDDGTLLVLAYGAGQIWRLTLDASMVETGRVLAGSIAGAALDGIAKDEDGRYYLGKNNTPGGLLRTDATFGNVETLLTNIPSAANIAWGKGALGCMDVYVASSGPLGRYQADALGRP